MPNQAMAANGTLEAAHLQQGVELIQVLAPQFSHHQKSLALPISLQQLLLPPQQPPLLWEYFNHIVLQLNSIHLKMLRNQLRNQPTLLPLLALHIAQGFLCLPLQLLRLVPLQRLNPPYNPLPHHCAPVVLQRGFLLQQISPPLEGGTTRKRLIAPLPPSSGHLHPLLPKEPL